MSISAITAIAAVLSTGAQIQSAQKQGKARKRQAALEKARRDAQLRREVRKRRAVLLNTAVAQGVQGGTILEQSTQSVITGGQREQQLSNELDAITRAQISSNVQASLARGISDFASTVPVAIEEINKLDLFGDKK